MTKLDSDTKIIYIKTVIIVSAVLVAAGGWFWWAKIYNSPKNIFNNMIDNSLATFGVTRSVSQSAQDSNYEQLSQMQFGAKNLVDIKTTINQKAPAGETTVITRTIATPKDNYVSYSNIKVANQKESQSKDFSQLLNIWGKQTEQEGGRDVYYDAVYGAILFGYLPQNKRVELTNFIQDKNLYQIDYSKVTSESVDGRAVYKYPIEMNTKNYIELLKLYDQATGLKAVEGVDPAQYQNSPPVKVSAFVDKKSHQLARLVYEGGGQDQTYKGYGIRTSVEIPGKSVDRQELEGKLQKLLNGQ